VIEFEKEPPAALVSAPVLTFSPTFAALAKALVAAKKNMGDVRKNASNPAFKSKYADLASVVEAIEPALLEAGIAPIQGVAASYNGAAEVRVETMLLHESGEFVKSILAMRPTKADPQGIGSATTYARRYALQAICGVAPEDDDGNAASGQRGKPQAETTPDRPLAATAPTQKQLADLRALFDRAFAGSVQPPAFGTWLEKNVAPDIRTRAQKIPNLGEIATARDMLGIILAEREAEPPGLDFEAPADPPAPADRLSPQARGRIMALFTERKAALRERYPDAKDDEARRHAFAAAVLDNEAKGSSKTWGVSDYQRVTTALEAIPPDAQA